MRRLLVGMIVFLLVAGFGYCSYRGISAVQEIHKTEQLIEVVDSWQRARETPGTQVIAYQQTAAALEVGQQPELGEIASKIATALETESPDQKQLIVDVVQFQYKYEELQSATLQAEKLASAQGIICGVVAILSFVFGFVGLAEMSKNR